MSQRLSLSLLGCSHMDIQYIYKKKYGIDNPSSNCLVAWTVGYCATSDAYTSKSCFLMLAPFFGHHLSALRCSFIHVNAQ